MGKTIKMNASIPWCKDHGLLRIDPERLLFARPPKTGLGASGWATLLRVFLALFIIHLSIPCCFALTDQEIRRFEPFLKQNSVGERIAFWAEKFVGTPYDTDPLGEYVSKETIVADERVDCMYLTFRAVELAFANTPEAAIQIALEKRFRSEGILRNQKVMNYDDRFEYGEDMIDSGKWGREITSVIGTTSRIKGSRGRDFVDILSSHHLSGGMQGLKSGDILFFIKKPEKREKGEIVGHLGLIKAEQNPKNPESKKVYLIHASGAKKKGGMVKKLLLKEYIASMRFIGVRITRFD
jgi:hypothetical protein